MDLLNFRSATTRYAAEIVNDTVMGGVSDSQIERTADGTAVYSGTVSLENNGGFASVQFTLPPTDLSGYDGVRLRVRGDGQRYGLNLRSEGMERLSYRAIFATLPDVWETLQVPFAALEPVRFGEVVPDAPPLATEQITMVGFIITEGQAGAFRLELERVWSYRDDNS